LSPRDEATFAAPPDAPDFVDGEIILRVRDEAVRPYVGSRQALERGVVRLPELISAPLEYLRVAGGAHSVEPVFSRRSQQRERYAASSRQRHHLAVAASVVDAPEGLGGVNVVKLPQTRVTPELLRRLRSSKAIEYVEPAPTRWLQASDPLQNKQWGLRAIHWFQATLPDAADITVAIVDSGIDPSHPDFAGLDISYDYSGTSAQDVLGHGTHVAGVITAVTNNGVGISGVCHCRLAVWKVTPDEPDVNKRFVVDTTTFLRSLVAVGNSGARVLNLSLGGAKQSRTEADVLARLEGQGVTAVGAMGNEYQYGNPTDYPGAYPTVLAVGAVGEDEVRAPYSNTGNHIGLVAPGSNVLSTVPMKKSKYRQETGYTSWSGTSMAAPHVTAAAALLLAQNPHWAPADVRKRLLDTARKLPDMKGSDQTSAYGKGLLDLAAALP
jgi:subtilisin family serine protease